MSIVFKKNNDEVVASVGAFIFTLKPENQSGLREVTKCKLDYWSFQRHLHFTYVENEEEFVSLVEEIDSIISSGVESSFS